MSDRPFPLPRPLAAPLAWVYRAGMVLHRAAARARAQALPIPVISVGNLSVGGTGKTPMVLHLARVLAGGGCRPCIAMRGYIPRTSQPRKEPSAGADGHAGQERSDEADAYLRALARLNLDIPVIAQADRVAGVRALLATRPEIDCVLLDDGFQHHRLKRDLDIVLIDATRPPWEDRLLPAGWLREPVSALGRAGAVVVTHAEAVPGESLARVVERAERHMGGGVLAVTAHQWDGLDVSTAGAERREELGWLRGRRALIVCAIGNPDPFVRAVREAIGGESPTIVLRDHDPYEGATRARVLEAARSVDVVVTTDKDWSKMSAWLAGSWGGAAARPRLRLGFERGQEGLESLVRRVATEGAGVS